MNSFLMLRQMPKRSHGVDECQYQPMHALPPFLPVAAALKGDWRSSIL
jgi:hypothetical protein